MGRDQHTNPRQNPPLSQQLTKKERSSERVRSWIRQCRWISESAEQMAAKRREKEKREKEQRQHDMLPRSKETQLVVDGEVEFKED